MNESDLKRKLFKLLTPHHHIYVRKLSDRFHAGVLDVFLCYQGRAIWCELKVLPNKLTPLQDAEIQKIRAAGGNAVVIAANKTGTKFYLGEREYALLGILVAELLNEV